MHLISLFSLLFHSLLDLTSLADSESSDSGPSSTLEYPYELPDGYIVEDPQGPIPRTSDVPLHQYKLMIHKGDFRRFVKMPAEQRDREAAWHFTKVLFYSSYLLPFSTFLSYTRFLSVCKRY